MQNNLTCIYFLVASILNGLMFPLTTYAASFWLSYLVGAKPDVVKLVVSDFLPMRCDACQEIFCKDHITYASHKCMSSYKKVNADLIFLITRFFFFNYDSYFENR